MSRRLHCFVFTLRCARVTLPPQKKLLARVQTKRGTFLELLSHAESGGSGWSWFKRSIPLSRSLAQRVSSSTEKLKADRTDPFLLMALALADVALGRKEEAMQEGRRATEMRPISE